MIAIDVTGVLFYTRVTSNGRTAENRTPWPHPKFQFPCSVSINNNTCTRKMQINVNLHKGFSVPQVEEPILISLTCDQQQFKYCVVLNKFKIGKFQENASTQVDHENNVNSLYILALTKYLHSFIIKENHINICLQSSFLVIINFLYEWELIHNEERPGKKVTFTYKLSVHNDFCSKKKGCRGKLRRTVSFSLSQFYFLKKNEKPLIRNVEKFTKCLG